MLATDAVQYVSAAGPFVLAFLAAFLPRFLKSKVEEVVAPRFESMDRRAAHVDDRLLEIEKSLAVLRDRSRQRHTDDA